MGARGHDNLPFGWVSPEIVILMEVCTNTLWFCIGVLWTGRFAVHGGRSDQGNAPQIRCVLFDSINYCICNSYGACFMKSFAALFAYFLQVFSVVPLIRENASRNNGLSYLFLSCTGWWLSCHNRSIASTAHINQRMVMLNPSLRQLYSTSLIAVGRSIINKSRNMFMRRRP